MREIKFRGKSVETGKWEYGNLVITDHNRLYEMIDNERRYRGIVAFETVGQFTGLKDKNGKEIYEGDIIEWTTLSGEKYRFSVEYSNEYAQYIITNTGDVENEAEPLGDYENIEVIGNIFENGDLLNDKKDL